MELKPVRDYFIVQREAKQAKAGLVIPDTVTGGGAYPIPGRVLAVGPGRFTESGFLIPMTLRPDDLVLLYPNTGHPVETEDHITLYFHQPGDVLCVMIPEKPALLP